MNKISYLRINGIIDRDMSYTARPGFETPIVPVSFPRESDSRAPADYTVSLHDKKGEQLWQAPAILYGGNDDFPGTWQLGGYIPLLATPGYYEIKRYNHVIYHSAISEKPPIIKITAAHISKTHVSISWEAQADVSNEASSLVFNAACRIAGKRFPLLYNSKTNSLDVDLNTLPGCAQAEIGIRASDGCRSSVVMTETFDIAAKPPVLKILSPANEAVFDATAAIPVCGYAMETGMGQLPFSRLQWFIEPEDTIEGMESKTLSSETGHLVLSKLSPGRYRIRLLCADDTHPAETSILFTVKPMHEKERKWQELFADELDNNIGKRF